MQWEVNGQETVLAPPNAELHVAGVSIINTANRHRGVLVRSRRQIVGSDGQRDRQIDADIVELCE